MVWCRAPVIPLVERGEAWLELREGVFEYLGAEGTLEESLGGPDRGDHLAVVPGGAFRIGVDQSLSAGGAGRLADGPYGVGDAGTG